MSLKQEFCEQAVETQIETKFTPAIETQLAHLHQNQATPTSSSSLEQQILGPPEGCIEISKSSVKVTLSAPSGKQGDSHEANVQQLHSREARRSTSTLISASDSRRQLHLDSCQEQEESSSSGRERGNLSRQSSLASSTRKSRAQLGASQGQVAASGVAAKPISEQSPKQLSIYINGKIRSNSIFCRSASSSSFVSAKGGIATSNSASGVTKSQGKVDTRKRLLVEATCSLASRLRVKLGIGEAVEEDKQLRSAKRETNQEATAETDFQEEAEAEREAAGSYKLNPSSMFLRKAMRYYRIWIYCTNVTILLGTLLFVLASLYVVSDFRIKLFVSYEKRGPSLHEGQKQGNLSKQADSQPEWQEEQIFAISYTEPLVLLAYAIVVFQAGFLQAIGCFGAIRMKERWIQAFWLLILALTIFDVIFLTYWINRYDSLAASVNNQLSLRLARNYGNTSAPSSLSGEAAHFDKIITEIMDKIQRDSRCCGINSSQDYKNTKWRRRKVDQLAARLNWSLLNTPSSDDILAQNKVHSGSKQNLEKLHRVPLVPASCCRREQSLSQQAAHVIMDDTQLARTKPARVPAWSPSMVVDHLDSSRSKRPKLQQFDGRNHSPNPSSQINNQDKDDEFEDETFSSLSVGKRRLLAKAQVYNRNEELETEPPPNRPDAEGRERRWAVESTVDEQQRVLSRLTQILDTDESESDEYHSETQLRRWRRNKSSRLKRLARLRDILFSNCSLQASIAEEIQSSLCFRSPNRLQLSFEQYKLLENYLLNYKQRRARSIFDSWSSSSTVRPEETKQQTGGIGQHSSPRGDELWRAELMALIRADSELQCAPKSYYDVSSIYIDGCYPSIKAWLESSAHLMFVAGFCILTVLKFCSLVLLRLEIREMIHKIKVLKGMATEYNELQDLEAYLPRSPLAAQQAADIMNSESVSASALAAAAAAAAGSGQVPTSGGSISSLAGGGRRIGGSFSDAVAAAAAAAAASQTTVVSAGGGTSAASIAAGVTSGAYASMAQQARQQDSLNYRHHNQTFQQLDPAMGLASSGRAMSMRAMAAISNMLQPSLCARSSSAHLNGSYTTGPAGGGASSSSQQQRAADLFLGPKASSGCSGGGPAMYRRHTAISVCPAAAAAAAAAAAHQFMSRRGTYVANPIFNAAPLINPGLNQLSQHRHSAHTVHTLAGNPQTNLLCPQLALANRPQPPRPASQSPKLPQIQRQAQSRSKLKLNDAASQESESNFQEQESSQELRDTAQNGRCSTGSHQLLPMLYPFKRQSSAGAQSASLSSPDPKPATLIESRRSIH